MCTCVYLWCLHTEAAAEGRVDVDAAAHSLLAEIQDNVSKHYVDHAAQVLAIWPSH